MKPDLSDILGKAALHLFTDVIPVAPESYAMGSTATIGMLLLFASQEAERGARIRVQENEAMRLLFARTVTVLPAGDLRTQLANAATSEDDDLSLSALNAANAELKADLIALHEFVETWDDPRGAQIDAEIWRVLREATEARALVMPEL